MRMNPIVFSLLLAVFCASSAYPGTSTAPLDQFAVQNSGSAIDPGKDQEVRARIGALQVPFVENSGPLPNSRARYYANTIAGTIAVADDGINYTLPKPNKQGKEIVNVKESLIKANKTRAEGINPAATKVSFFKGNDKSTWKTNIPTYEEVTLGEVYNNIKLSLKAYNKNVEKLFVLEQGSNPGDIAIQVQGTKGLNINKAGELEIRTRAGILRMTRPAAYQQVDGKKVDVNVVYAMLSKNSYGFKVGAYDKSLPLVIDPLIGSTFLGEVGTDIAYALYSDGASVYITGWTNSLYFPVTDTAYNNKGYYYQGGYDVFISKLSGDLTTLEQSTFLGGSSDDLAYAIAADENGTIYVAGSTKSPDFPIPVVTAAFHPKLKGAQDAFIAKLSSDLTTLIAATYLGGSSTEEAYALAIAPDVAPPNTSHVYVTGYTLSNDFPTLPGSAFSVYNSGSSEVFVSKLDTALTSLVGSTFLGGSSADTAYAMTIDPNDGAVYVTGCTQSAGFPTSPGAYRRVYAGGKSDAFIAKFDPTLGSLLGSTFLGGSGDDCAYSIAFDNSTVSGVLGGVFVTGYTTSTNYPTTAGVPASYRRYKAKEDGIVTRLTADLKQVSLSAILGGSSSDFARSVLLVPVDDDNITVYVSGFTKSTNLPFGTTGAYKTTNGGGEDLFVSRLSYCPSTGQMSFDASTYIGGTSDDRAYGMALDGSGNIIVTGYTKSTNYPTTVGAYQKATGGKEDAFVTVISPDLK